jgi:hypothetical protein
MDATALEEGGRSSGGPCCGVVNDWAYHLARTHHLLLSGAKVCCAALGEGTPQPRRPPSDDDELEGLFGRAAHYIGSGAAGTLTEDQQLKFYALFKRCGSSSLSLSSLTVPMSTVQRLELLQQSPRCRFSLLQA